GRLCDASGTPQASEFRVNSYTTGAQAVPAVAADSCGDFVVVWHSFSGQDGSTYGVFGQRFDPLGAPKGAEFRVNSYTTSGQSTPAVAADADGDFVVVWQSTGQDGSQEGLIGQRYGDLIFEDGFESGDLTRWSAAATDG